MMKTKLGDARLAALKSPDKARTLHSFHCDGKGRALSFDESKAKPPVFRAAFLVTAGAYRGRIPFRQVLGLVCGMGRVVVYDRFGLAAKWMEGGKPVLRRRGMKFSADRTQVIEAVFALPPGIMGWSGSWTCPSCDSFEVSPDTDCDHLRIPLCEHCKAKVKKEKDWVGYWACFSCGDRVADDELRCPWCDMLAGETGARER